MPIFKIFVCRALSTILQFCNGNIRRQGAKVNLLRSLYGHTKEPRDTLGPDRDAEIDYQRYFRGKGADFCSGPELVTGFSS